VLLSPFYWVLVQQGNRYSDDPIFVHYLLTLIGSSLPAALCGGMVYRLARTFELRRSLRVALGLCSVAATGVLTYGTVLNRHVPAALLLLCCVSCISHLAVASHPYRHVFIAFVAGLCAALAASLSLPAIVPASVLCFVFLAMRWNMAMRIGAVALYVVGALPVVALTVFLLGLTHPPPGHPAPMILSQVHAPVSVASADAWDANDWDDETSGFQQVWSAVTDRIGRVMGALLGEHGVLSHYPALILGVIGATLVLHRNWSAPTKMMAALTLFAAGVLVIGAPFLTEGGVGSYAAPWFICMGPLVFFWSGAWLRRRHRVQSWSLAGVALAFSLAATAVGMVQASPRDGYRRYSFIEAAERLLVSSADATAPRAP